MTFDPLTGPQIRAIREDMKLSREEFADALNMGVNGSRTVAHWEAGERGGVPYLPNGTSLAAIIMLCRIRVLVVERAQLVKALSIKGVS